MIQWNGKMFRPIQSSSLCCVKSSFFSFCPQKAEKLCHRKGKYEMPHAYYKLFHTCGKVLCGGSHVSSHILILILKKSLLLKMINNNNSTFGQFYLIHIIYVLWIEAFLVPFPATSVPPRLICSVTGCNKTMRKCRQRWQTPHPRCGREQGNIENIRMIQTPNSSGRKRKKQMAKRDSDSFTWGSPE